ncbi:MAG: hypothetical protein HYZ20_19760 [Burkholderiales bacterium]|nr:hypothetical protein [Burkholderiales bacterium]
MSAALATQGPGDAATWGRPTGHPHDPRTEDDCADNTSRQYLDELPVLVGYYAGNAYGCRYAAADIEITDVVINGHELDPLLFAPGVLCEWQRAIAAEINGERDMAADCAAIDRLEDGRD